MNCPNCGHPNDDNAMFCGNCGKALGAVNAPPSQKPESQKPQASTPKPKSRSIWIVVAVVVIVIVVIAVVLLVGLNHEGSSSSIENGDYMTYDVNVVSGSQFATGTLRIDISNVMPNNLTVTYTITTSIRSSSFSQVMNYTGGDWATASVGDSGGSSDGSPITLVGHQTISTVYGNKAVDHYTTTYSGYTYDYWAGTNGCPYKLLFIYSNGMTMECTLSSTNIQSFK